MNCAKANLAWLALPFLLLGALILFTSRSSTVPPRPTTDRPLTWTVDRRTAAEFTRPRDVLLDKTAAGNVRLAAAGLRARAKGDASALEELIRDLRAPTTPRDYRAIAALVLGTIAQSRAQDALLQALLESTDPQWTALLIHALGADKSVDDDEIFDLPDSPFVYELAGLRLRIQTKLDDDAIRAAVARFASDEDVDVRRAAARTLIHSGEHADLRRTFVELVQREPDDGIRAGYGHALARWAATAPLESTERGAIMRTLLDAAARAEDTSLRFRLEEPMRRAPMNPSEIASLLDMAERGTTAQQIWSLSILRAKSETGGTALESTCVRLTGGSDPKVREYAVNALAGFKTSASTGALVKSLNDPEWNVRIAATRALAGRPEARTALQTAAASDADERVRAAAEESLRKSGP